MIKMVDYLYNKLRSGKFYPDTKQFVNRNKANQIIAALYLVKNNKGTLFYYPNNRGRYEIQLEDYPTIEFKVVKK